MIYASIRIISDWRLSSAAKAMVVCIRSWLLYEDPIATRTMMMVGIIPCEVNWINHKIGFKSAWTYVYHYHRATNSDGTGILETEYDDENQLAHKSYHASLD